MTVATGPEVHEVFIQMAGGRYRWACTCAWAEPEWHLYFDPHAGPQALLHAVRSNRMASTTGNATPTATDREETS